MSQRIVTFLCKVSLFIMIGLMSFPIISNALNVYVPSSITYNPATGRVTGTVYSYESQISVDFRNRFGHVIHTVGSFVPSRIVNGYDPGMAINQFDIESVTGTNYNPEMVNIHTRSYNSFDKTSEVAGTYHYSGNSGILKEFKIGLQDTMYTGVNNVPFTQYISGSTAHYGNPFEEEGYTYFGGFDIKPCQISSSDPSIASISEYAQITTRASGDAIITAVCDGISRSQPIKVLQGSYKGLNMPFPFDVYSKDPSSSNYFIVNAYDQNGVSHDVTQYASYSYTDNSVLSIDKVNKKAIAITEGYTVVTATYRGLTSSVPVIVVGTSDPNVPNTVFSSDTQVNLEYKNFTAGTTIRPELLAYMGDRQKYVDVTRDALFVLDDVSKGVVNPDHSITLATSGPVTIIAIYKNHYQKLYVNPPRVTSIKFGSDRYNLHAGETINTVLYANYSDMSRKDVTNSAAHYAISNPMVARVDQHGVITGIRPGIAQISAVHMSADGGFQTITEVVVQPPLPPVDEDPPVWPADIIANATEITSDSALINWTSGMDNVGINSYKLYSVTGSTYNEIATVSSSVYHFRLTNLTPNSDYRYSLKALDAAGNSSDYSPHISFHTSNRSGGGGGGGGGGAPEAFKWDIVNQDGKIRIISSINSDQLKKLSEEQLKVGKREILIDLKTNAEGYDFQLKAEHLKAIEDKHADAVLVVKTTVGTAEIPFTVLREALKTTGGKDQMSLKVSIDSLPNADQKNLEQTIASNGGASVGKALSYELSLVDNNKTIAIIDSFSEFVGHMIPLPKDFKLKDGEKLIGAVWDPETNELVSVPLSITSAEDGKPAYAALWRKGNSIYTLFTTAVKHFEDVNDDYFASKDIESLASSNIIQGFEDGTFRADTRVTRAEFAALLVRGLGLKSANGSYKGFSDVNSEDWFNQAVYSAVSAGLISGYEDGTFRPAQSITHQEAITMVSNALTFINAATKLDESERARYLQRMNELAITVDEWAVDSAALAMKRSILNTNNGFTFLKDSNTTRGETAALINRLLQNAAWPEKD